MSPHYQSTRATSRSLSSTRGVVSSPTPKNPLFVAQAGTSGDARYVAFVDKAIACAKATSGGDNIVTLAMEPASGGART